MQTLRRAIRRELRLKLLASLCLLASGAGLCFFFFDRNVLLTIVGLAGIVLGLRFTYQFVTMWHEDDTPLMRLLKFEPQQIVWVYSVVTERLPFGFQFSKSGTLYFKLRDGDEHSVSMSAKDLKRVSEMLNRLLPHATFGYSRDREQWFMAAPELLLRDDDERTA